MSQPLSMVDRAHASCLPRHSAGDAGASWPILFSVLDDDTGESDLDLTDHSVHEPWQAR